MGFEGGSSREVKSINTEKEKLTMEESVVRTDAGTATRNECAEIRAAVQDLIVKINNLVQHIDEPEYLVDLISDALVQKYGRERIENTARLVMREGVSECLSKKFTDLLRKFASRYFGELGELFSCFKVKARYRIDRQAATNMCRGDRDDMILELPVSSEAVMVERLMEEMLRNSVGRSCWDVYMDESNRLYEENAPMAVHPETRFLSADAFIATYKQRPMNLGD
jgi:hypothetical protein